MRNHMMSYNSIVMRGEDMVWTRTFMDNKYTEHLSYHDGSIPEERIEHRNIIVDMRDKLISLYGYINNHFGFPRNFSIFASYKKSKK